MVSPPIYVIFVYFTQWKQTEKPQVKWSHFNLTAQIIKLSVFGFTLCARRDVTPGCQDPYEVKRCSGLFSGACKTNTSPLMTLSLGTVPSVWYMEQDSLLQQAGPLKIPTRTNPVLFWLINSWDKKNHKNHSYLISQFDWSPLRLCEPQTGGQWSECF